MIGFGVLAHYLLGSKYRTGDAFVNNISLWWGSPLLFSSGFIQIGGLGMAVLGFIYLKTARLFPNFHVEEKDKVALSLTLIGLIALFLTGFIGYFIVDAMYPGFYYTPIDEGKNLWLILQGISCLLYVAGLVLGFGNIHDTICDYYKKNKVEPGEKYRR